jgi:hypothetical protein
MGEGTVGMLLLSEGLSMTGDERLRLEKLAEGGDFQAKIALMKAETREGTRTPIHVLLNAKRLAPLGPTLRHMVSSYDLQSCMSPELFARAERMSRRTAFSLEEMARLLILEGLLAYRQCGKSLIGRLADEEQKET